MKFLFVLLSLNLLSSINCGKCPSKEVLSPCICTLDVDANNNGIHCGGNAKYDLKKIFRSVSDELLDNEKHFYKFYFNNTAIDVWEEDVFNDITFDNILIEDTTNLTRIHTNALTATSLTLKEFRSNYQKLVNDPPNYNIFDVLSKCVNIERVVIYHSLIASIPANAFRPLNGIQSKLREIYLGFDLQNIGDNAFYELPNIQYLGFRYNLTKISENTFNLRKPSNNSLTIDLAWNELVDNSFSVGAFSNTKRPLKIDLEYDNITYLDEKVFAPFFKLNEKNSIDLYENPINCSDCRNAWILKDKTNLQKRMADATCSGLASKSLFDVDSIPNCS